MKNSKAKRTLRRVRPLLGTYVTIELTARATEEQIHEWINAGFAAIDQVDRLMSIHRPESDISRLNRARPGEQVQLHPWTSEVLRAADQLRLASEGVFDIRCSGDIDLGGIAKGYAVDRAVEIIQKLAEGIHVSGTVNAGGDLRRWGDDVEAIAVATSSARMGDHSSLTEARHIQMPERTLFAMNKTVTVAAKKCLWSDALTKVLMMGSQEIAAKCLALFEARGWVLS